MSAEEMRSDLEIFVNRGLSEGWGGWPTKGLAPCRTEIGCVTAAATPLSGVQGDVLMHDRGLAWFTRTTPLQGQFKDAALGRLDLS